MRQESEHGKDDSGSPLHARRGASRRADPCAENLCSVLAENVLLHRRMERDGRLHRMVSVVNTQYSSDDSGTLHEFPLAAPEGFQLLSSSESNEEVLAAVASAIEDGVGGNLPLDSRTEARRQKRHRGPTTSHRSGNESSTAPSTSSEIGTK